ncbi:MAG: hypothetical protein ABIA63_15160 [bacterium]
MPKDAVNLVTDIIHGILMKVHAKLPERYKVYAKRCYAIFAEPYRKIVANAKFAFVRPSMGKIENINLFEQRIYSQNGEDGIIKIIFYKIGTTNKFCVEFGVGDGTECNTRYLIENCGWNFLHMDCGDNLPKTIKKEFVSAENINSLFKKYNVPKEFDLLSIDIDNNDYWIWKSLSEYSPRVVIIEYNSLFPATEAKVIKYEPITKPNSPYIGASLLALEKMGKSKGYTLLARDNSGVNAFFIRNDLIKDHFAIKRIEDIHSGPHT